MIDRGPNTLVEGDAGTRLKASVGALCSWALLKKDRPTAEDWRRMSLSASGEGIKVKFIRHAEGDIDVDFEEDGYSSNGVHGTATAAAELRAEDETHAEEKWTASPTYSTTTFSFPSRSGTRRGNEAAASLAVSFDRMAAEIDRVTYIKID